MSTKTTPVPAATLRRIVALDAAGATDAEIATTLMREGHVVPRADVDDPATRTATLANRTNFNTTLTSGYNLATVPGSPGTWTADAVAQVLASAEIVAAVEAGGSFGAALALTIA